MRLATIEDRAVLLEAELAVDVARASGGRFGPDPMSVFQEWEDVLGWALARPTGGGLPFDPTRLGPPSPRPAQVFAVALNYRPHAAEAGFVAPDEPLVFTKFPSCLTGPCTSIVLPPGHVDWELELVVVIGRGGRAITRDRAWEAVAGLTVGQDLSERLVQSRGAPAQFSLGKSFPGFGPTGPWLVTPDELDDPDDLELVCTLSGVEVQHDRTRNMIFPVPDLIARLSAICALLPGDLIFTGTPAGVGNRRDPQRFIAPGDVLVSEISGIGSMRHEFVPHRSDQLICPADVPT